MATVPLPDVPCLRVRLIYDVGGIVEMGNRFYLRYSGSAPSGANCTTLASDIATAFGSNLESVMSTGHGLKEVDVLDIATDSGLSGQWTGNNSGTRTGTVVPWQIAMNVELGIARRYRGGKPRMYFPFGVDGDLDTPASWADSFVSACSTQVAAFFTAVEALSVGSVGTLTHVNLSYYKGFQNFTTPSGRERAVPKYRDTALHDDITGYFAKKTLSSQKRRRTSKTP